VETVLEEDLNREVDHSTEEVQAVLTEEGQDQVLTIEEDPIVEAN
jgi:hypothetical protein